MTVENPTKGPDTAGPAVPMTKTRVREGAISHPETFAIAKTDFFDSIDQEPTHAQQHIQRARKGARHSRNGRLLNVGGWISPA